VASPSPAEANRALSAQDAISMSPPTCFSLTVGRYFLQRWGGVRGFPIMVLSDTAALYLRT